MKMTNEYDLPAIWVKAVEKINSKYSKGKADFTASQILNLVRQIILKHRHYNDIEEDVSDCTWRIFGQLFHSVMEDLGEENALVEERLYADILGKKIGGKFDRFENGEIIDFKTASISKIKFNDFRDWENQLNIYSYLLRVNGFETTKLSVLCILKDHKLSEAEYNKDYPQRDVMYIELPLWDMKIQKLFITHKIQLLIDAADVEDDNLPECTDAEIWAKQSKWAIKKPENKKASKLCDTRDEATFWIENQKRPKDFILEYRPGERTRCKRYCIVNKFCNQYQEFLEKK